MTYSTLQDLDSSPCNVVGSRVYGLDTPSLNKQRKAALADVDSAAFSSVASAGTC